MATDTLVKVDLRRWRKFKSKLKELRFSSKPLPMQRVMKQWHFRYKAFIRRRFVKFSRGAGDWPPLKHKRRRGSKHRARILWDTGLLLGALDPMVEDPPGWVSKDIPYGIKVGFGGPHRHKHGDGVSIADIAMFHHVGAGNLPVRKIIVKPSGRVVKGMARDLARGIQRMVDTS